MGRRHQAFLIARVRPSDGSPRYRCIGCFHHQWCYGHEAIGALSRFLLLIENPENAAVVRGELRDLDGKYKSSVILPIAPCPYTLSLLGIAWTTDLAASTQYLSGVNLKHSILPANEGWCWHIGACLLGYSTVKPQACFSCPLSCAAPTAENNEGITVIDITDVSQPGYCFVRRERGPPLSAHEYLSCYKSFWIDASKWASSSDTDRASEVMTREFKVELHRGTCELDM